MEIKVKTNWILIFMRSNSSQRKISNGILTISPKSQKLETLKLSTNLGYYYFSFKRIKKSTPAVYKLTEDYINTIKG